jgi:hypothetical protein
VPYWRTRITDDAVADCIHDHIDVAAAAQVRIDESLLRFADVWQRPTMHIDPCTESVAIENERCLMLANAGDRRRQLRQSQDVVC